MFRTLGDVNSFLDPGVGAMNYSTEAWRRGTCHVGATSTALGNSCGCTPWRHESRRLSAVSHGVDPWVER